MAPSRRDHRLARARWRQSRRVRRRGVGRRAFPRPGAPRRRRSAARCSTDDRAGIAFNLTGGGPPLDRVRARARELLAAQCDSAYRHTDRLFAGLLLVQWVAGIAVALDIFAQDLGDWHDGSQWHLHVWAAIFVGGAIALPAAAVAWWSGQHGYQVIAVAQMLYSALLIHVTGGRIETHFHVFGSLAIRCFTATGRC